MAAPVNPMAVILSSSDQHQQHSLDMMTDMMSGIESNVYRIELDVIWNNMVLQFTPFNVAFVTSLPTAIYHSLDAAARDILKQNFEKHTNFVGKFIRDGTNSERWLLGPAYVFKDDIHIINDEEVYLPHQAEDAESKKSSEPPAKKIRIRRPPNAYILYRKDHHELVKKAFPGIHNNQISTIIGAKWRNEDASVKLHYHNRATQLRNDLLKLFPDYKYQPRKPGEKKKRARRGTQVANEPITVGSLTSEDLENLKFNRRDENLGADLVDSRLYRGFHCQDAVDVKESQATDIANFNFAQGMGDDEDYSTVPMDTDYDEDALRALLDGDIVF